MTLRTKTVDVIFDGLELAASLYDWVRKLRREEPIPLTQKSIDYQREQIRRATTPPPK